MKAYEFIDVLVARAKRSPANSQGEHYVKLSESDIEQLSEAGEALFAQDPESLRAAPLGDDE